MADKLKKLVGYVVGKKANGDFYLAFWDPRAHKPKTLYRLFPGPSARRYGLTHEGQPFEIIMGFYKGKKHLEILPSESPRQKSLKTIEDHKKALEKFGGLP
jgi:hypothetical protein